jgi:hypothetical protein
MLKGQPAVTLKRPAVLPAEKAQRLLKSPSVGWMLPCAVVTRHA